MENISIFDSQSEFHPKSQSRDDDSNGGHCNATLPGSSSHYGNQPLGGDGVVTPFQNGSQLHVSVLHQSMFIPEPMIPQTHRKFPLPRFHQVMESKVQGVRNSPRSPHPSPGGIQAHGYKLYGHAQPIQKWQVNKFMHVHYIHPNMHSVGNESFSNTCAPVFRPSGMSPPGTASGCSVPLCGAVENPLNTIIRQNPQSHVWKMPKLWNILQRKAGKQKAFFRRRDIDWNKPCQFHLSGCHPVWLCIFSAWHLHSINASV